MRRLLPLTSALAALASVALGPVAAAAGDLGSVVYERTLMRDAGARCKLFEPRLQTALEAGVLQARSAALRAGVTAEALERTAARASAKAGSVSCAMPDLRIAAQRVRAAFLGWSRQSTLALPGVRGRWSARRWPDRSGPFWALSTSGALGGRPFTLGLRKAGRSNGPAEFALETLWPEAGGAYLARLVVRDPALAPAAFVAADGQPPAGAARVIAASAKVRLNSGTAWRFRFPDAAADAMARLDPRENVRLELVFPGDRTASALVEVGDFAVGRAFLSAGP